MTSTKRTRPRFTASVRRETLRILEQVGRETALPNRGVALDYIIHDWVKLKRAALIADTPAGPCSGNGGCAYPPDTDNH
jgi:hypothetical protein